jgi:hypothetical protein
MSRSRNLGYGEGSIYQEGDTGRWRGEFRIGVKRRRVSAWTRREVVEKLDELRSLNAACQRCRYSLAGSSRYSPLRGEGVVRRAP